MKTLPLDLKRELSLVTWAIKKPRFVEEVNLLLQSNLRDRSVACVEAGERVLKGQKIADPVDAYSVAKHASVSGQVKAVATTTHPVFGPVACIKIVSDQNIETLPEYGCERNGLQHLTRRQCLSIFQEMGLTEHDLHAEPLHVKLSTGFPKSETLFINACEPEPYVTSGYSLMMSHPLEVLKGAEILRNISDAKKIRFFLDQNQLDAAEFLKSKIYFLNWKHVEVEVLEAKYPQGLDDLLPLEGYGQTHDAKKPLFKAATAFAVHEALVLQKPQTERVVTIGGECIVESQNVWAPMGVSFAEAIKFCRGLLREPRKVLMDGPMRGIAQKDLNASVYAGTQAILALPKEEVPLVEAEDCIRCGQCIESCPVDISPVMITLAAEKQLFDIARDAGAEQCIECGNCSFVCPSKRPMLELIRYADSQLQWQSLTPKPPLPRPRRKFRTLALKK